jgi:hypothetical protein
MEREVLRLAASQSMPRDDIRLRLKRMASLLIAIEAGELLSALPSAQEAQAHHQTAVNLLAILSEEMDSLIADLA